MLNIILAVQSSTGKAFLGTLTTHRGHIVLFVNELSHGRFVFANFRYFLSSIVHDGPRSALPSTPGRAVSASGSRQPAPPYNLVTEMLVFPGPIDYSKVIKSIL